MAKLVSRKTFACFSVYIPWQSKVVSSFLLLFFSNFDLLEALNDSATTLVYSSWLVIEFTIFVMVFQSSVFLFTFSDIVILLIFVRLRFRMSEVLSTNIYSQYSDIVH